VARYPSTFAAALTLLSLSLLLDHLAQPRLWRLVVLGLLTSLTLLVHPTTAVVLLASLPVVLVTVRGPDWIRRAVPVVLTVALATALAIAWPHFSLLSLVATRSPDFDKETRPTLVAPPPWRCGGARKASPNVDWHLTDP
jgi:4-amino-4-deoxy-L-arabinose transferase-like glycosyltransferase